MACVGVHTECDAMIERTSCDTTWNASLPIAAQLPEIDAALTRGDNVVLQADPGAGKSTAVPSYLLSRDWLAGQKILMLEPRRLAVKSLATYLARCHQQPVGQSIGYQVRHERRISQATRLEILTEGILTRRLQSDPELAGIGLVIFDEFHERSLHADLALTLLLEVQSALRPDLRILVMSATLAAEPMAQWLGAYQQPVSISQASGRQFPVTTHYLSSSQPPHSDWLPQVPALIRRALTESDGDVLVFLPGEGAIHRLTGRLNQMLADEPHIRVRALYGRLPPAEQSAAIAPCPAGERKVVLATNIAETSLTIEGITAVVDSGWQKQMLYDPNTGLDHLQTQRLSQASAEQRRGRAGRLQAGHCYRLWREADQARLSASDAPEIQRVDLSRLCLELAQWGVVDPAELHWLTPPPAGHFAAAQRHLQDWDLLDTKGAMTEWGQKALKLPVSPRLAAMLLRAPASQQALAASLAAFLTEGLAAQSANRGDVDFLTHWTGWHQSEMAGHPAHRRWQKTTMALRSALGLSRQASSDDPGDREALSVLLALAYPERVARRMTPDGTGYQLAQGGRASLPENAPLRNAEWLVAAEIAGESGRMRLAVSVTESALRAVLDEDFRTRTVYRFDAGAERVRAYEEERLGAIVLRQQPLAQAHWSVEKCQACLLQALQKQPDLLRWPDKAQAWLDRVRWLSHYRDGFAGFEAETLMQTLDQWLAPFLGDTKDLKSLARLDWVSIWQTQLGYDASRQLAALAPPVFEPPAGRAVPIGYDPSAQSPPTVSVPLQALFGMREAPRLAGGQVALRFELLSPARRPIQVTSDLAGFWQSSYHEVAKDMRGRYPKHRWPEDPMQALPGRSVKH
ncbi:MAG: ATP-dependent helicase HrpB [Hydrogenovibrio sp.]|uniref:ATP-dependent helicase HrpB n=1 Tax=Hydrogenovibrio sp. TaxID=2065821 RepID=UPI0028700C69|nr:ATP-dependent helicase HrpB [Hydrogenovibrio sp.]MDR9499283.1 ATP-dependent helicase HrpB [Hydrogenovibrio sp.]